MKPVTTVCVLLSLLGVSTALSPKEFHESLSAIDAQFITQGPSSELLSQYDSLIFTNSPLLKELEKTESSTLAKMYHKKAIIELSMGKESQSIADFLKSLQLNPQNLGARNSLLDLVIKHGNHAVFDQLKALYKEDDAEIQRVESTFKELHEWISENTVDSLTKAINVSPLDSTLRSQRIQLITDSIKTSGNTTEQLASFPSLIDDYSNLLKISPIVNSDNLNTLSDIYLFGVVELSGALNMNKKCIHYDMDNAKCKANSKVLNKYSSVLSQLSNFHKIYTLWDQDDKSDEDVDIPEIDVKDLVNQLTSPEKFHKIRRVNEDYKTNLDFIKFKSQEFNKLYNLKYNYLDLVIIKTELFDAFLRNNVKEFKKFASELVKLDKSYSKFFLITLHDIDTALSKNDYNKVQNLLSSTKPNMQKTQLYQQRHQKLQAYKQQQQRQQQHQQQQYFHQQQQHQQRRPQQQQPPKNDYYKILDVPRNADLPTIKKAYREKTKLFHPDKYKGDLSPDEVQEKMTSINHAYEVLSDDQLRKNYDMGEDPNDPESGRGGPGPGPGGPGAHGFNFRQGGFGFGGNSFGGNPFGNNMKFNFGGMNNKRSRQRRH